jgi:hypothetical protein
MIWNNHSADVPEGAHAFLGPSKYSWLNYDDEKLANSYKNYLTAQVLGTRLHALACEHILLGLNMPKSKTTLNMYVNDAIGFRMRPEQALYFSENCFGTADAIAFKEKTSFLRIHDLKTGMTPASMKQLEIYAALFCLEYRMKPTDLQMELRIYQNDDILIENPIGEDILPIMEKIIEFDKIIESIKQGE